MSKLFCLSTSSMVFALSSLSTLGAQPYQANSIKVGEVTDTSAIIWTRLTSNEVPDTSSETAAAPGHDGQVQLTWWPEEDPSSTSTSGWASVNTDSDFTYHFSLSGLTANTAYTIQSTSRPAGGGAVTSTIMGRLKTAPAEDDTVTPVLATLVTCQGIGTADHAVTGHSIYNDMLLIEPDFFVHTGDIVYYDKDYQSKSQKPGSVGLTQELSTNQTKARQRWNRMFGFTYNQNFSAQIPSYFMKDDHDATFDDSWPGRDYFDLTWEQGLATFAEQTPSGPLPYRTIRWGKDLQIWLLEGRDFRSPNHIDDGPDKTILGDTQKAWLKSSLQASDATFKLVVSPTPIVGPDKPGKVDSHSTASFQTEGNELRQFLAGIDNCFVVNGDRHWQYASIDPVTGLREYGTGSINAVHDFGGAAGYDESYHTYWAQRGGYLSIRVERQEGLPQITFRYHDIDTIDSETGLAQIAYEETLREAGFGLVTITRDNVEETTTVKAMTRYGYHYHIETSTDLIEWTTLEANQNKRGALLTYEDDATGQSRRFYRITETEAPAPETFLAAHTSASYITTFPGSDFNRVNFVFDLGFTTPSTVNADTDVLLLELGGGSRGTGVALIDGKLAISAGQSSAVTYTGSTALAPSTKYTLRVNAISEESAGQDSFTASLWTEDAPAPTSIIDESGLSVDGFSGSDDGGVGVVGNSIYSSGLSLPTASPPASVIDFFNAYDPDLATVDFPLRDQPAP